MDNQQERSFNIGWFVGALESEGSLSLTKGHRNKLGFRYTPMVMIVNSSDDFINSCRLVLEKLDMPYYVYKRRQTNGIVKSKRGIVCIQISGHKRCKKFLEFFMPLMKVKYRQAVTLLNFVNYRLSVPYTTPYGEIEEQYRQQMKELNGILRDYTSDTTSSEDIVRSHVKA